MGQRSVWLLDHKHRHAAETVPAIHTDLLATARMKGIVDRYRAALIMGSMSLYRPVPERLT
jgi:hypothetical protein